MNNDDVDHADIAISASHSATEVAELACKLMAIIQYRTRVSVNESNAELLSAYAALRNVIRRDSGMSYPDDVMDAAIRTYES